MSERLGDGYAEAHRDPEVTKLLDFLDTYDKIQALLSWLVESGAAAPLLKAAKRAQLQRLMQLVGIDTANPDDPGGYGQLADLKAGIADRSLRPEPRIKIPDVSFFERRIAEVKADFQSLGVPYTPDKPVVENVFLLDVLQHGYVDWNDVQSRTGNLPREIHYMARIMTDPVAYRVFANSDQRHIAVGEDWSIQNGRHRSLAAVCLGEDFIRDSGMDQWVYVEVERAL